MEAFDAGAAGLAGESGLFVPQAIDVPRVMVLRRLGYRTGSGPTRRVESMIERAEAQARELVRPLVLYRRAPCVLAPPEVRLGNLTIRSAKVAQTLAKAHTGVVFLATLGEAYDGAVDALQAEGDTFSALLLEAYAAAGVHALLLRFREWLRNGEWSCSEAWLLKEKRSCNEQSLRKEGRGVSRHYCPGYEGWPLEDNARLFHFLGASTRGFVLTEGMAVVPKKSLMGVLGLGAYGAKRG